LPPEPPLGYRVDAMPLEPSADVLAAAEQPDASAGAAASSDVAPHSGDGGELGDAEASSFAPQERRR
jgi:hypothetical protein